MPNLMPCPMPTCSAPIDAVHLVPQGMGGFTCVVRCGCGLSFDTGAQSEAAADCWNERPAPAGVIDERAEFDAWHAATWPNGAPVKGRWEAWQARAKLIGSQK
jgi:hypothetical protein